jgi:hypothetical protein
MSRKHIPRGCGNKRGYYECVSGVDIDRDPGIGKTNRLGMGEQVCGTLREARFSEQARHGLGRLRIFETM